jgi:hypothetical protein
MQRRGKFSFVAIEVTKFPRLASLVEMS